MLILGGMLIPLDYFRAAVPFCSENELRALSKTGKNVRKIAAPYLNKCVFQRLFGALSKSESPLQRGKQFSALLSFKIKEGEILSFDDEHPSVIAPNFFQRYTLSRFEMYNRAYDVAIKLNDELLKIAHEIIDEPINCRSHALFQMRDKAQRIIITSLCIDKLNVALKTSRETCKNLNMLLSLKHQIFSEIHFFRKFTSQNLCLSQIKPYHIQINSELDVELKYVEYSVFSFYLMDEIFLGAFQVRKLGLQLLGDWVESSTFTKDFSHLKITILQWMLEIFLKEKADTLILQTRLQGEIENPLSYREGCKGDFRICFQKYDNKLLDCFGNEVYMPSLFPTETWESYIKKNRLIQDSGPFLPD